MKVVLAPRVLFLLITLACGALLGYAYYLQYSQYLDPCPLCIFQRIAFFAMGLFALIAAIHGPKAMGAWIYSALVTIGGILGLAIAGRHLWLQSLPPDQVPSCGPGLEYMLDQFPLAEVLKMVLTGSGSCATVVWNFLGLSMPAWTLVWYLILILVAVSAAIITGKDAQ